jgi:tetratricopeptide (TPR) repeat protein
VEAREAVRLRPDLAYAHAALGFVYYAAGRFEDAAAELRRAIAIDPRGNYLVIGLAHVQESEHRYAEARDTLRSAVARDPADVLAATRLARVHVFGWGDLDAARAALQAVPTAVASSGALCFAWFEHHLYARDYAAAMQAIDQAPPEWFAIERVPREFFQARVYQAQGDAARARAAFAAARTRLEAWVEAAREDNETADLRANLALILAGLGESEAALREAERALALMPLEKDAEHVPERLAVLAEVNARAGKVDAAVKLLSQLLTMPAGATISVPLLRLDPAWDPIRGDTRFQALLTSPSAKGDTPHG